MDVLGVAYIDTSSRSIVYKFKPLGGFFSVPQAITDLVLEHCFIVHDRSPLAEFACYEVPDVKEGVICCQRLVEGTAIVLLAKDHHYSSTEIVKIIRYVKEHRTDISDKFDLKFISDVTNFDKIEKVNAQLIEVKTILVSNIEKILDRGEKLEDLVARSERLSKSSKDFHKRAKKMNSCCVMF